MTIRSDLESVIPAVGYRLDLCAADLDELVPKLERLQLAGRYGKLLRDVRTCNDRSNLLSLVTEATFAYAFEAHGMALEYEIPQVPGAVSTIDFRRTTPRGTLHSFELRVLQQRASITASIETQLARAGRYAINLDGDDERREILRLQSVILSKCLDGSGQPVKFLAVVPDEFNFAAVDVSDPILGALDEDDCVLALRGDPGVPWYARREVFGIFQRPVDQDELAGRFEHPRTTIHGVLFLRRCPRHNPLNFELRYFLVLNPELPMPEDIRNELLGELRSAMRGWHNGKRGT